MPTPTPIYSLPFFTIEQMRAVSALLLAYIDSAAPDTTDHTDWTPPEDLVEVSAVCVHLDAAIRLAELKPMGPPSVCLACHGSGSLAGDGGPAGDCDFCGGQGWN